MSWPNKETLQPYLPAPQRPEMWMYDNPYQAKRCPMLFKYLLVVSTVPNPYQLSSVILIS